LQTQVFEHVYIATKIFWKWL